jgi:hypothetical protein
MSSKINKFNIKKIRTALFFIMFICLATALFGQDIEQEKDPFILFLPVGYNGFWLDEQTIHNPAAGIGFMLGKQDLPFTQIERRLMGMAMYMPFIFPKTPQPDVPKLLHEVGGMFDGRFGRHQALVIFQSASDEPISGGLNTFQLGAGYGYEVIRRPQISLILGAVLCVTDFKQNMGINVSSPVLPMPLIRLGVDTKWFDLSMDFITGPNLDFTVAPEEKVRLTGDVRIDTLRSITDVNCEFAIWYRLFSSDHKLGDFFGLGAGFKNEVTGFNLSRGESFELQRASVFAAIDLSIIQIQSGWVIDSTYIMNDVKTNSPGKGFFLTVHGMIPIINRQ